MEEIWKDIKDYEGLYQVSNLGRVKSLEREIAYGNVIRTKYEKILKIFANNDGYLKVDLHKNGKRKSYLVHRLVAEVFLCNPNNLIEINHKDEDKTNNDVSNLEWCDRKYNVNYGTGITRRAKKLIGRYNRKEISKPVLQYTKDGQFIAEYPSAHEAKRCTGINRGNICMCCNGNSRYSHAGGYVWRYKIEN